MSPNKNTSSEIPKKNLCLELFKSFFKIGLFTFGGGYAMIPLIQNEVVYRRSWVDEDSFLELLTLAQSAPGPISLNTAVFVGYSMRKWKGALAAILGVIIPSFVIILAIAVFFADFKDNTIVEAAFKGMRPAVVALIVAPVFGLSKGMGGYRIALAIVAAGIVWRFSVSPIWFIIAGAVGGLLWMGYRHMKNKKEGGGHEALVTEEYDAMKQGPLETPAENVFETEDE